MPAAKRFAHTHKRAKARHTKKTYKKKITRQPNYIESQNGGDFGIKKWWQRKFDGPKFISILTDYAVANSNIGKFDPETDKLLYKGFHKIFTTMLNNYTNAEIKHNTTKETIGILFYGIDSYSKSSSGKYQISKYAKNKEYLEPYFNKLKNIIDEFIKYLANNDGYDYGSRVDNNEIKAPVASKSKGETFSHITFYGGNDGIKKVPNIIYRIKNPEISAGDTNKEKTRFKLRHTTANEFINSSSDFALALYYFMKYKAKQ